MYSCTTPHSHVHTSKHTSKQVNTHANTPPTPSLGKSRQISFQYAHRKPKTGNGKWKAVLENNFPVSHTHSLSLCPQTSAVTLKGLQWKKPKVAFQEWCVTSFWLVRCTDLHVPWSAHVSCIQKSCRTKDRWTTWAQSEVWCIVGWRNGNSQSQLCHVCASPN